MSWPQAQVGAITIDVLDRATVLARIAAALDGSAPPAVLVSVNLDHVYHFAAPSQALPCGTADGWQWYTLLDGQPVVRAARRRLPAARPEALPGSELLEPTLELAAARGARLGLVGGSAATREYWQDELPARYPGLSVVGAWPVDWAELDRPGQGAALAERVAAAHPDLLVVSLGKPRQELWLRDHVARTGARVALPFGSAVDYVAGTGRRPPALARRLGAEWLVRLAYEPRRLGRRYLIQGPPALLRVRREMRPVPRDPAGSGAC